VIKEHGDDNDLRDEYSAMLENYGRGKQASAVIAGTLKKNPKDASALLQRVKLELDAGDIEPAAKDAKALQDLKALSPQLTFDEARIAGARGESTRQGDLLAELLRSYPRFLAARLELSRLLVASGKGRNAVELLNLASPAEQRNADYVFYRNTALMSAGEWDEAKKSVAGALAVSHSPGFLYQDAVVRLRDRDLAGARKSIESAFQISPDAATLNLLGEVMRQQREFPAYVAMLKDAVAKSPQSAALQTALGSALTAQGDQKGARAAFEAAKTAGNTVDADFDLALLDMRNGALDQAKQRLLELVKGHDNARSRLLLAEIETRKGSPDMVIQHYLKAIELEPQNAMAMNNLADFLSTQKKFDDAVFWAKKALATAPNSPIAEDTIGWIYFRQAKYEDAMPFLEKSLKGLDRPVAHYHLAAALFRAGDPRRAKQEYEIGVKQNPGSHERDEVRPMFETR
jgi:tetratricopeptide (TPR) repeat protein